MVSVSWNLLGGRLFTSVRSRSIAEDPEHHHIFLLPESRPLWLKKHVTTNSASGWALLRKSIEELYDPNMKTVTFRASHLALLSCGGVYRVVERFGGLIRSVSRPPFRMKGMRFVILLYLSQRVKESMYGNNLPTFTWSFLWIILIILGDSATF